MTSAPTREQPRAAALSCLAGSIPAGASLGLLDAIWFLASSHVELIAGELLRVLALGLLVGLAAGFLLGLPAAAVAWFGRKILPRWSAIPLAALALIAWTIDATAYRNLYPEAHTLAGAAALLAAILAGAVARRRDAGTSKLVLVVIPFGLLAAATASLLGPLLLGNGHRIRQPLVRETTLIARALDLWPGPELSGGADGLCAFPGPASVTARSAAKGRSVLIITVDALRADVDGPRLVEALPKTAARLEGAVVFDRVYTAATRTNPSIYSLLTGRWPHRVKLSFVTVDQDDAIRRLEPSDPILLDPSSWRLRHQVPLDDDSPTLAGLAASAGYRTGTVVPYVFFRPEAGTTRGFQDIDITPYRERNYSNDGITSDLLTERALRWFDGLDRGQPWLFWMHYIDPHSPYHAYGEVQPTAPAKARYLSEFRRVDDALDDLFAGLDERGLLDDAVLILAADHGEEFGEHGGRYHGTTVFEEQARVPLLFRVPGVAPRRVSGIASLVDVTPTVVDLLGLSTEATFDGQSLWDAIRGEPLAPRPVLSLSTLHGRRAAIIDGDLKLIADMTDRTLALFDLSRDPRERRNLADERPEEVRRLLCKLQASGIIELDGR